MRPTVLLPGLLLALLSLGDAPAASTPNIVFLFADDMGWADTHCYGHPYARTPNIDRLAADGTRFLQCYATGVTCCPSRTGFMTSKFPATYARYPANGGFGDRVTITQLLKQHGYATGHFGKWHIGPDESAGTYGIDVVGTAAAEGGKKNLKTDPTRSRDAHIYDAAIAFIEQHRQGPFYVNVWGHVPHYPIEPTPALIEAFGPLTVNEAKFAASMQEKFALCKQRGGDVSQHMQAYLAELKGLDDEIGRFLNHLDELGLRDNTIVVFSSDQGPAPIRESDEQRDARKAKPQRKDAAEAAQLRLHAMGYAGDFRGSKHNQHEGGVRIPFIVRWPGHAPAGRVDETSVISGIDWLPTLCALAGIPIKAADFDGENVSKAWQGDAFVRSRPLFWKTSSTNSDPAIRDGRWKLHGSHRKQGEVALYDIVADPTEQHDLAAVRPDIVKALSAKLQAWQATLPQSYDKSNDGDK